MFIYQAFRFEDAPLWMLNGQNRLFTQEVLPSKCLINKRQHLTSSFEKPLCSQVLFKYLIRYTLFFFFKAFWWMYSSLTCTHSRNKAELSIVVWRAALGVDCAALGVNGGRLIAGCDVQIFNDSLSVSERVANKQTNKKKPHFVHA